MTLSMGKINMGLTTDEYTSCDVMCEVHANNINDNDVMQYVRK